MYRLELFLFKNSLGNSKNCHVHSTQHTNVMKLGSLTISYEKFYHLGYKVV
jgi:hypothetical protein